MPHWRSRPLLGCGPGYLVFRTHGRCPMAKPPEFGALPPRTTAFDRHQRLVKDCRIVFVCRCDPKRTGLRQQPWDRLQSKTSHCRILQRFRRRAKYDFCIPADSYWPITDSQSALGQSFAKLGAPRRGRDRRSRLIGCCWSALAGRFRSPRILSDIVAGLWWAPK